MAAAVEGYSTAAAMNGGCNIPASQGGYAHRFMRGRLGGGLGLADIPMTTPGVLTRGAHPECSPEMLTRGATSPPLKGRGQGWGL